MYFLAERRALACVQTLASLGVDASRVYPTTEACSQEGGRVEFRLQLEAAPKAGGAKGGGGGDLGMDDDLPESAAARLAAQRARAMSGAAEEGGVGWMASGAASASPSRLTQAAAGTIAVALSQLRLSEGVLRDGRVSDVWVEVDLLGLVEREHLQTPRLAKRGAVDLGFVKRFAVDDGSAEQGQLRDALRTAESDPSRGSDEVTLTLWGVDKEEKGIEALGQAGVRLLPALQSGTEPGGWLPLRGRLGNVGSVHVSLGIVATLAAAVKAEAAAVAAAAEAAAAAKAEDVDSKEGADADADADADAAADASAAAVEKMAPLEYRPPLRERMALALLQRFCKRRHLLRKQGKLRVRRLLAERAARAAEGGEGGADTAAAARNLARWAEHEEERKIEQLLRPPSPVRKVLDKRAASVLTMQKAWRGAVGRRRAAMELARYSRERPVEAGGGAKPLGMAEVAFAAMGKATLGGDRVDDWKAWLLRERQREAAAALMGSGSAAAEAAASASGGFGQQLASTGPLTLRLFALLPHLPLASASRALRLELTVASELSSLLAIDTSRLKVTVEPQPPPAHSPITVTIRPPNGLALAGAKEENASTAAAAAAAASSPAARRRPASAAATAPASPGASSRTARFLASSGVPAPPEVSCSAAAMTLRGMVADETSPLYTATRWLAGVVRARGLYAMQPPQPKRQGGAAQSAAGAASSFVRLRRSGGRGAVASRPKLYTPAPLTGYLDPPPAPHAWAAEAENGSHHGNAAAAAANAASSASGSPGSLSHGALATLLRAQDASAEGAGPASPGGGGHASRELSALRRKHAAERALRTRALRRAILAAAPDMPDWLRLAVEAMEASGELRLDGRDGVPRTAELPACLWPLAGLGYCGSLQSLALCQLGLAALHPAASALASLVSLDVSGNALATLPDALGQLGALQRIDASHNHMTACPACVWALPSLRWLSLRHNALGSLFSLPMLPACAASLEEIDLGHNLLPSLPEAIGGLFALRALDLSHNRLQMVPSQVLALQTKSLRMLDLAHNAQPSSVLLLDCHIAAGCYVAVEFCTAPRPSASLKGDSARYVAMFAQVARLVSLLFDGAVPTIPNPGPAETQPPPGRPNLEYGPVAVGAPGAALLPTAGAPPQAGTMMRVPMAAAGGWEEEAASGGGYQPRYSKLYVGDAKVAGASSGAPAVQGLAPGMGLGGGGRGGPACGSYLPKYSQLYAGARPPMGMPAASPPPSPPGSARSPSSSSSSSLVGGGGGPPSSCFEGGPAAPLLLLAARSPPHGRPPPSLPPSPPPSSSGDQPLPPTRDVRLVIDCSRCAAVPPLPDPLRVTVTRAGVSSIGGGGSGGGGGGGGAVVCEGSASGIGDGRRRTCTLRGELYVGAAYNVTVGSEAPVAFTVRPVPSRGLDVELVPRV